MQKRYHLSFLFWLVLPILLILMSINYLLNNIIQPRWQITLASNSIVSPRSHEAMELPPAITSFNWQGGGLVTFWFDDAWISQYETALPILEKYSYKAAVAVPTSHVGFESYMNWFQLRRVQFLGWEVTAHSRTHNCDENERLISEYEWEILGSKEDLQKVGLRQDIYVLPCGVEHKKAKEIIQKNFSSLRTVQRGLNSLPIQDPYSLKIIEVNQDSSLLDVRKQIQVAKQTGGWIILTFHQISDETTEFAITPVFFEEVVKEVNNSGMPVVLPSQVLNIK